VRRGLIGARILPGPRGCPTCQSRGKQKTSHLQPFSPLLPPPRSAAPLSRSRCRSYLFLPRIRTVIALQDLVDRLDVCSIEALRHLLQTAQGGFQSVDLFLRLARHVSALAARWIAGADVGATMRIPSA